MIHLLDGHWKLNDQDGLFIDCSAVYSYIKFKDIQSTTVDVNLIGHKELESICVKSVRYLKADITMPTILVKNMENPQMKKYRMIDGRHRLKKVLDNGENVIKSYILDRDEALKFIRAL